MSEILNGRFRLLERIGAGGMGVVYRAIDQVSGETVACKVLDARDANEVERAHREAEALARLWHPAIVRHIADGIAPDGALYLVMAWVDGENAAERLIHDGFTLVEAVAMVKRIAGALAAAHASDVLHRDIKPSNVLLAGGDPAAAMLIDFGVSRMRDAVRSLTRTGTMIGTPGYMSPEQARGDRELGPGVDVFGLGCLLYECASARPAFSGTNAAAVITKILISEPPPFETLVPESPPALSAIVTRMLAKDAAQRFPDCIAVAAALDALGELPAGPRRSARSQVSDPTRVGPAPVEHHCLVAASRGATDDITDPPAPEQRAALAHLASSQRGRLEVLATGGVIAHLTGEPRDASCRAAIVALAMRKVLPGWSIVISSVQDDAGTAAEAGTVLLSAAAIAAIFKRGEDTIIVDPGTATLLTDEFELVRTGSDDPKLVSRR